MSHPWQSIQAWKHCMRLVQNCSTMRQLKAAHAAFLTHGIQTNNYAMSKLISFCALSDSGDLSYASLIFSQIQTPNSFIYNTLIRAYSRGSQPHLALHYLELMLREESGAPDHQTFPFVLSACASVGSVAFGRQVHNWLVKNGLALLDSHVQTALVRFYASVEGLSHAKKVFDEIASPDLVQINVLMNACIEHGFPSRSLDIFRDMLIFGLEPDEYCLTTALKACSQLGTLGLGKWIHDYVKTRKSLKVDVFLGTALVDMYAKCGCIEMAAKAFEAMPKRNVCSWAAIIGGFALNGFPRRAKQCLERMQEEDGLQPDGVILLGILAACTHAGLQDEGLYLLENMETLYDIKPKHEHYGCVVDLLCRAGKLEEALQLIKKMPMEPLASVWGALLSGSRTHNNIGLAEIAAKELLMLETGNEVEENVAYVQLSNIYLAAEKDDHARRIRKLINDKGIKKTPGCSMIEVKGEVNEFVSGDASHMRRAQIQAMLNLIFFEFNSENSIGLVDAL